MSIDLIDLLYILAAILLGGAWWRHWSSPSSLLPPGPRGWPVVGNLFQILLQRRPFIYIVRDLRLLYGPIFSLRMGQRTLIIISSPDLIHSALIRHGPLFSSRPADSPTRLLFSARKCTINSAPYGPLWRSLRRNLVSQIVSPNRLRSFSALRHWAIDRHLSRLRAAAANGATEIMPLCRLTICSILVCICFGARVRERKVREIEEVLKEIMMMTTPKLADFLPALTVLFRGQLREARRLRERQMDCIAPLVRARRRFFVESKGDFECEDWEMVSEIGDAYVDSLMEKEVEGKGRLGDEELVTLCSEVMSAGTDTSATAVEWAMMHLVIDQAAQDRLYDEVKMIKGRITEDDVEKMPYLAAVVKETLRRHPPSHFVLSHAATRDAELAGYRVPAAANVEFYTAWLTEDPDLWTSPQEWKPERFLEGGEGWETDVTGTKGVRMMPFGVGRRICPAASLGMLHVQLLLANMVREFKWAAPPGEKIDPTETFAFTVVMKKSLRAVIHERG